MVNNCTFPGNNIEHFLSLIIILLNLKNNITKFEKQITSIPRFLRAKFKGWKFVLNLFSDDRSYQYLVFPYEAKVEMISDSVEEQHFKSHIHK